VCVHWLAGKGQKRTFTARVLLPVSVSDGMGGRAPSTIFWYSSARRRLTQSIIVNCVSRSRDSISGRLSQLDVVVVVVVGLCGAEVTTFVDADAALAAPRRATCSIFPARPRSRENHARTLCHDCAASLLEDPEADECGTANTASIFFGGREGVALYKGERRGGRGDGESGTKHSQDLDGVFNWLVLRWQVKAATPSG